MPGYILQMQETSYTGHKYLAIVQHAKDNVTTLFKTRYATGQNYR